MHRKSRIIVGMANGRHIGERLSPHRHDVAGGTVRPRRFARRIGPIHHGCGGIYQRTQCDFDLPCRGFTAVFQRQRGTQCKIVRHLMHGAHRIGKSGRPQGLIHVQSRLLGMFKQPKQHAGGAELQCLRHIHTVCVADNHM